MFGSKKDRPCPFCKTPLPYDAVKCTQCDGVKDFTRYNSFAVFLLGFFGSLVIPFIVYFFLQISITLGETPENAHVSLALSMLIGLCVLLFVVSKLPYLKGKWMRAT